MVGAGVMGCSVAYHLMKFNPNLKVVVVERDPTYEFSSTALSMGGVRVQFSLKENVLISLYGRQIFEHFEEEMAVEGEKPNINYRRNGYLFLINSAGEKPARDSLAMQKSLGAEVEWWSPDEMKKRFPLLDVLPWMVGATFGSRDGYLDAYALLMAYRKKARSMGAQFIEGDVTAIEKSGKKITGVKLASGESLKAKVVVNSSGAWAAQVANTVGVKLPIDPVKRQVFFFKPAAPADETLPLIISPNNLYFRPETGGMLSGNSRDDDAVGFDFAYDRKRFEEMIWPGVAEIIPTFDRVKLIRGYAGLYDVNRLDCNAMLGPWPELEGFYLINGFSGHGLQQAPAVGRYLAELILQTPISLDLSIFSPKRLLEGKPLSEQGIV